MSEIAVLAPLLIPHIGLITHLCIIEIGFNTKVQYEPPNEIKPTDSNGLYLNIESQWGVKAYTQAFSMKNPVEEFISKT